MLFFYLFSLYSETKLRSEWLSFLKPLQLEEEVDKFVENKLMMSDLADLPSDMLTTLLKEVKVPIAAIARIYKKLHSDNQVQPLTHMQSNAVCLWLNEWSTKKK
jgi:hypothetical protein